MASFKPIIFLFFLLLLLQQNLATAADLIGDTCAQIAAGDPNVNSTFCEAVLRQASGSADADLCGLAVISARLAMANATAAEAAAAEMLEEEEEDNTLSRYERSCLESCCELYGNAGYSLDAAVGMVEGGRFDEANVWMSAAVDAPVACEEGFQEGGLASPLAEEDGVLFQLAVIALAITACLQKL